MEIFLVVLGTILVIGLFASILFNILILGQIQSQSQRMFGLEVLTKKYTHDQQQMFNLFVQFIISLNNFTQAIDDFAAMQGGDMTPDNFPQFPHMEEGESWKNNLPDIESRHALTEDEINKLSELLNEEDDEEDGQTQ